MTNSIDTLLDDAGCVPLAHHPATDVTDEAWDFEGGWSLNRTQEGAFYVSHEHRDGVTMFATTQKPAMAVRMLVLRRRRAAMKGAA